MILCDFLSQGRQRIAKQLPLHLAIAIWHPSQKNLPALSSILQKHILFFLNINNITSAISRKTICWKRPDIFQIYFFGMGCSASSCAPGGTKKHISRFYLSLTCSHDSWIQHRSFHCANWPRTFRPKRKDSESCGALEKVTYHRKMKGKGLTEETEGKSIENLLGLTRPQIYLLKVLFLCHFLHIWLSIVGLYIFVWFQHIRPPGRESVGRCIAKEWPSSSSEF